MRRPARFFTMEEMATRMRSGLFLTISLSAALASMGCVSAEQHHEALADLQRLRVEAWQRSVESAALRLALDRANAENAQLRTTPRSPPADPAITALAARVEDVARRQEQLVDEVRAIPACAPAGTAAPSASAAQAPSGRKVTDLLYSRF